MSDRWHIITDVERLPTPALVVYPDRVDENLRRMIAIAGGVSRLRPHVKTHKMPELVRRQMALGITKFKCATIAEAEMLADCGAPDVMLAYQPVGPNATRLAQLAAEHPDTKFSTLVDDPEAARMLSAAMVAAGQTVEALIDLDVGMHRTGIEPGPAAMALYRLIALLPGLKPGGLHVYDGHIRATDVRERADLAAAVFAGADGLKRALVAEGLPVPRLVAGGTPTFAIHARREDLECSPGTCVFWDHSYGTKFADLPFLPAALLVTRVVSRPAPNRVCLDLGFKAVSPDNPDPRVHLLDLPDARAVVHSEEHLVVESAGAVNLAVGDVLYGVPFHICPTCALYSEAVTIEQGRVSGSWPIVARDRRLTV
jgi:D-serine deaminase-like pyridoxal phosphate-dependent protein